VTGDPDLAKFEEKGVKGRYVSVESIKELPNGNIEWRVATSSSPGGRIPTFVVDSTMASTISAVSTSSKQQHGILILMDHLRGVTI
jgi:hypothetical protein